MIPESSPRLASTLFLVLLPPRNRVLEKLIVTQISKKYPAFHGTRTLLNVFIRVHHWKIFVLTSILILT
jgi:hypothetical protein